MTTMSPNATAFLAFAVVMVAALLGPLASADLVHDRTRFTIWATLLLAIPAVVTFVLTLGRAPPGRAWRAWWTAAFAAYLAHLWFGFGLMFAGDFAKTFDSQGTLVAGGNFALAVLWWASLAVAWSGGRALWLHLLTTLLLAASAITSTLVFGRPHSTWIGALFAASLIAAVIGRLWLLVRPRSYS
jgi:hypothetical protein